MAWYGYDTDFTRRSAGRPVRVDSRRRGQGYAYDFRSGRPSYQRRSEELGRSYDVGYRSGRRPLSPGREPAGAAQGRLTDRSRRYAEEFRDWGRGGGYLTRGF
jgi:hypothetical protein